MLFSAIGVISIRKCVSGYFREWQNGSANVENTGSHFCKSRLSLVWCWSKPGYIWSTSIEILLKRIATDNNDNRSEIPSLLSQLPRNTFNPGGCHVILSQNTEAKQIRSKGKCRLKIPILLFYFVPSDPATYQTPVASIVSFSTPHCSLAIWDGAHSMGWYCSLHDII